MPAKAKKKVERSPVEVALDVAPSPHVMGLESTSARMMVDVWLALLPVLVMALYVFRWYALAQVALCVVACVVAEYAFVAARGKPATLRDCSAVVTGAILGLSLPWNAPWYCGVVGSVIAIGIGKVVFGGLGANLFNPAMVGRAFIMISFPAVMGAAAYQKAGAALTVVTQATPMTAAKQLGHASGLSALLVGNTNGSLGETSAIACLIGGLYLCFRRTASWEIPAGMLGSMAVLGLLLHGAQATPDWTVVHHLLGGAALFGAFFIATDPVTSPVTPKGKALFGIGVGLFVMVIRLFSGYPEGVMFAVLIMNAVTPLLNRWTVPRPVGGRPTA